MFWVVLLHFVVAAVLANPVIQNEIPTVKTIARAMGKSCENGIFSATCLKIEALSMLEKLNAKDEVHLLPGVTLTKAPSKDNESNADEFAAELARSLPSKPDERLDKYLLYRLGSYLNTHSVTLRLLDDNASEEARALIDEGRGKGNLLKLGGKKGGMGGILALAALYKSTLLSMGLGGIGLLAGKALMTALVSLVLSAIIGLKSLSSKGSSSYEVIAKPLEDVGGWGGHSAYRRQLNVKRR